MMCAVCAGTGYKSTWARYGVATGTGKGQALWADHAVLEPCQCQLWAWPNEKQPICVPIKKTPQSS